MVNVRLNMVAVKKSAPVNQSCLKEAYAGHCEVLFIRLVWLVDPGEVVARTSLAPEGSLIPDERRWEYARLG